jgi:hypothetical protein
MTEYFKYKIKTKEIILIKPPDWSIATLKKIASKKHLHRNRLIKFIIYYSQKNYKGKHSIIHFNEIDMLDSEIVNELFVSYINSDASILLNCNEKNKVELIDSAFVVIKSYIDNLGNRLGSLFTGVTFVVHLYNSWINSLKGEITNENIKQLDCFSKLILKTYNKYPKHFKGIEFFIKNVRGFIENKEFFYEVFTKVGLIIEKAKKSDIWIPSRYSQRLFEKLLPNDIQSIEKIDIEKMIYDYAKNDIVQKYLNNWLDTELMKKREKILKDAFETHKRKLFAPAICFFLTQLDFVILRISKLLNLDDAARNVNTKMINKIAKYIEDEIISKKYINDLFPENGKFDNVIYLFQTKSLAQYLNRITFADTDEIKNDILLNRHGILHGKFTNYSTENNSKKVILLIDELICFYKNLKTNLLN